MITRPQAKTQDESKHAGQAEVGNHRTGILGGTQEDGVSYSQQTLVGGSLSFSSFFLMYSFLLSFFYYNSCVRQPEK